MKKSLVILFFLFLCLGLTPSPGSAATIEQLSQAISTAPTDRLPTYYIFRSRAYLAMGDEASGLADLEMSLLIRPSTEAYLTRGGYFLENDRLDEAIKDFSAALAINDDNVKAYELRSKAFYAKKEYTNALIDASHITLHAPEDPFALNMIEKCYIKSSPRERIVLRSNVAEVLRARRAARGKAKAYIPQKKAVTKTASRSASTTKKNCGPRRRS